MDYKVILSRPALSDIGKIARTIAQDNVTAALKVGGDLLNLAQSLAQMPRRGGVMRGRANTRRLVHAPYLITYRIDETQRTVFILRFWHSKRDPKAWREN